MGNRLANYSFTDEWESCDEKNGFAYVWCKSKAIGTAPTKYIGSALIGGTTSAVKGAAEITGDLIGDIIGPVWQSVKYPVIIGGGVLLLIIILK